MFRVEERGGVRYDFDFKKFKGVFRLMRYIYNGNCVIFKKIFI